MLNLPFALLAVLLLFASAAGASQDSCRSSALNTTRCTFDYLSGEALVNQEIAFGQLRPAISSIGRGRYVVVWQSEMQDGSLEGIYGRIFRSRDSAPLTREFRINTFTNNSQRHPRVAGLRNGNFVVVWQSVGQDGSAEGVFARTFTDSGVAQSPTATLVNSERRFGQIDPDVAALGDSFAVVWTSEFQDGSLEGVYMRIFYTMSAGTSEIQVNQRSTGSQRHARVANMSDGSIVVVWESHGQITTAGEIYVRRFTGFGRALSDEVRVNTVSSSSASRVNPAILGLPSMDAAIAWQTEAGGDASADSVHIRRLTFLAAVETAGLNASEEVVNTATAGSQRYPSLSRLQEGGYVVGWQSEHEGSVDGVFVQAFNRTGHKVLTEWPINVETSSAQARVAAATVWGREFIATWQSANQDGSVLGVYQRRLRFGVRTPIVCPTEASVVPYYDVDTGSLGSCTDVTDCRAALCNCMTGSFANAQNNSDWGCLGAGDLYSLGCDQQGRCFRQYRNCLEAASSTVDGQGAITSSACRTWGRLFRDAASQPYAGSLLQGSCEAAGCDVYRAARTRCSFLENITTVALCEPPPGALIDQTNASTGTSVFTQFTGLTATPGAPNVQTTPPTTGEASSATTVGHAVGIAAAVLVALAGSGGLL